MTRRKPVAGYTLLELSVVLIIVALVTAMATTSGIAVIASARQSSTLQKMAAIDQALLAFRIANDRLPCPGDLKLAPSNASYGVEAANPASCTGGTPAATFTGAAAAANPNGWIADDYVGAVAAEGAVPTATLGIPSDFMYDGWGNHIRYAVDTNMTKAGAFTATPLGAQCGPITVYDGSYATVSGGVSTVNPNDVNTTSSNGIPTVNSSAVFRTNSATYALISHGANGHGAYTRAGGTAGGTTTVNAGSVNVSELANCHCTSSGAAGTYTPTYVQQDPSTDTTTSDTNYQLNSYDDIVTYKERWQLPAPWDTPGTVCPAIYVITGNVNVMKFNSSGTFLSMFGSYGFYSGQFINAWAAATDSSGNVWVSDKTNNRVQEFDPNGNFLESIGGSYFACTSCGCTSASCPTGNGSGQGQLYIPMGVAVSPAGNVWVVDNSNSRVVEYSNSGIYLQTIGGPSSGTDNGLFKSPQAIALDASGNLWVIEYSNNRLQKFNSQGSWLQTVGSTTAGSSNGQFKHPNSLAIDSLGHVWVVDNGNFRLQVLSSSGAWLLSVGSLQPPAPPYGCTLTPSGSPPGCLPGYGNGQFGGTNSNINTVAIDANSIVYALDVNYPRIEEFSLTGAYLGSMTTNIPSDAISGLNAIAIAR